MQDTVPFDPGFSEFSIYIPVEAEAVIDEIARLKKQHQKKFEFQKFEIQVSPALKQRCAVYLGCILWGSYLFYRYKDDPKIISGNIIKDLPEEQQVKVDYVKEIEFLEGFIEKLNSASKYYLKRSSKVGENLSPYLNAYKQFCIINDDFKNTEKTDQIKLPEEVSHFENYDNDKLDNLKKEIEKIISSKNIISILELGFY